MPATLFGCMTKRIICLLILFFLLLASCSKNHLYVQQMCVDRNYLASTHVGTPDPRQDRPPHGQRLLVNWRFPSELFDQGLTLILTVRFWDQKEEEIIQPVEKKWSYKEFYFPLKLLTYRIQVMNSCNEIVETWEHQLWTELIEIK